MCDNKDGSWEDCAGEASRRTIVLQHFDFIITLVTTAMFLCYTLSATIQLQSSCIGITEGLQQVTSMLKTHQTARLQVDHYFSVWFADATQIAEKVDAIVKAPRTCASQIYRSNTPSVCAEEYF